MATNKELSGVKKEIIIFVALVITVMVAVMGGFLIQGNAAQQDMNGETVTHSKCTITDKSVSSIRGAISYFVATTCGEFRISPELYEQVQVGESYEMTVTSGNWANKPTIISVEPS